MTAPADRDPREVARRVLELCKPRPIRANYMEERSESSAIAQFKREAAPLLAKSYLAAMEAMRLAREALESALPAIHSIKCRANDYEPCSCGSGLTGKRIDAALSALDAAMKEPKPDVTKEAR